LSVPDALLHRIDAFAKARGESRSGYLRRLAEEDLEDQSKRRAEVKRLLGLILADAEEDPEPMPDAAQMIREDRDSR
jgi:metal-responsive CopG/Arc/MetJ family transcriptional regulator